MRLHRKTILIALIFIISFFAISLLFRVVEAQETDESSLNTVPATMQFSCLEGVNCGRNAGTCTSNDPLRVRLNTKNVTGARNSEIFITECIRVDNNKIKVNGELVNSTAPDSDDNTSVLCTTGNSELDRELFCEESFRDHPLCDRLNVLKESVGYSISDSDNYGMFMVRTVDGNEVAQKIDPPMGYETDVNGSIADLTALEIQSRYDNSQNQNRLYYAFYQEPTDVNNQVSIGGQQQARLTFSPKNSDCEGIAYEPSGRVFDTKTLEPIPGARVEIQMLDTSGNFTAQFAAQKNQLTLLTNPLTTSSRGFYFFYGSRGEYKMLPSHSNYIHPEITSAELISSNANITSIYSNRLYPAPPFSYLEGYDPSKEVIPPNKEANIQFLDIPMEPNNDDGYRYPLEITEFSEPTVDTTGKYIIYKGLVSHPFAVMKLRACPIEVNTDTCAYNSAYEEFGTYARNYRDTRDVKVHGVNNEGSFFIKILQSDIPENIYLVPEFYKVDLTDPQYALLENLQALIKKNSLSLIGSILNKLGLNQDVYAAETNPNRARGKSLHTIPSYLEGFAYDSQGNIIPNATVGIYTPLAQRPFIEIKTNENGFYRLTSDQLPSINYTISYSLSNGAFGKTTITTTQFMAQNRDFIEAENINLFAKVTQTNNPRRTVTPTFQPIQKISPPVTVQEQLDYQSVPTNIPEKNLNEPAPNQAFMIAGLLLAAGVLGLGFGYLMYRRSKNQPKI